MQSLPKPIPPQHTHIIQSITKVIKSAWLGSLLQPQSVCSQPGKLSSPSSPLPAIRFSDRVDLPNSTGAMPLTFTICVRGGVCQSEWGRNAPPHIIPSAQGTDPVPALLFCSHRPSPASSSAQAHEVRVMSQDSKLVSSGLRQITLGFPMACAS